MPLSETVPRARVLITDAAERSMIAAGRGLHTAGHQVSAAAFDGLAAGHWARWCSDRLRVTDPRIDAAGFVADLARYLERRPCAMVLPGSDFSLFAVSRYRAALTGLTELGLPAHGVVQRSFDREALASAAAQAGLEPAAAARCHDAEEAVAAADQFGYPVLMKSTSTVRDLSGVVAAGPNTRRIADAPALRAAVGLYGDAWLVQRLSCGRILSFGGVMAGGKLIGVAVSEYVRTWPPQAGNVTFSVTIAPPPGLEAKVEVLLGELGWEGMFELELIADDQGAVTPIDLNPRPYGSMSLAVASGANLPALWCDWVLARDRQPQPAAESVTGGRPMRGVAPTAPARAVPGRRYRWEDADLRHLLWQARRGHWRAAAQAARPWPGTTHAYFKRDDPLPFLVRVLALMMRKIRARLAAARS